MTGLSAGVRVVWCVRVCAEYVDARRAALLKSELQDLHCADEGRYVAGLFASRLWQEAVFLSSGARAHRVANLSRNPRLTVH